jgi:hypothetical protein
VSFTFNKNIIIFVVCFVVVAVSVYNQIMTNPGHIIDLKTLFKECVPLIVSIIQGTSQLMAHHKNPDGSQAVTTNEE